ncbi:MAG: hypothetical protein IKH75_11800 [Ruminococcus sp.]|nr:hypothetical protein [Ruminococcus sp.]
MANFITRKEYAAKYGVPLETVKSWTKCGKLATIKIGAAVFVDADTPIPARRKPGVKTVEEKELAEVSKLREKRLSVKITRAYLVSIVDGTGKEVVSDFTFGTKQEAEKLGEKLKREVAGRG